MTVGDATSKASLPREDGRVLRGEATREKVLDAAERLFAEHGFDGVSIRKIAEEAGVTLGVVGFHGGSKLDLFTTLLSRRVETLSAARRAALVGLKASPDQPPPLRDLIDAYVSPYLEAASGGDPQWRAYARLIARIVNEDRWYTHVRDLYDPVALDYIEMVRALFPRANPERLATAFVLSVASMLSLVASRVRIAGLAGEGPIAAQPENLPAFRSTLVDFCTGGIERAASDSPDPGS